MYSQVDTTKLADHQFVEVTIEDPAIDAPFEVKVGTEFYGYIRHIRISQDWKLDMTDIGNNVKTSTSPDNPCQAYGVDAAGANKAVCPFCSTITLDTHKEFDCYMTGTDDSYSEDERNECDWKCLRCDGPTDADCFACKPGVFLDL